MAWRIEANVVRGEIDNTVRDCVTGRIWLAGRDEPLHLNLKGNCLRDLAGCRITFSNPTAKPGDIRSLTAAQTGICGDLTVSRKAKIPTIPIEAIKDWKKPIPFRWGNIFYFEWYSISNGRVVIEAVDYRHEISLPAWGMTKEEEVIQRKKNLEAFSDFTRLLGESLEGPGGPPN
jgi:hypothetical protein